MKSVWVICPDNHSEGLSEPIVACLDVATADETMDVLLRGAGGYRSFKLIEVLVFPSGSASIGG